MNTTLPIRCPSGHIYRLRIVESVDDLPRTAGIYGFLPRVPYPGAPIKPVYWAPATYDMFVEVSENPVLRQAIGIGATCIGYVPMEGRVARRRALDDLLKVFPTQLGSETEGRRAAPAPGGVARRLS
jgi:hypothetical protein